MSLVFSQVARPQSDSRRIEAAGLEEVERTACKPDCDASVSDRELFDRSEIGHLSPGKHVRRNFAKVYENYAIPKEPRAIGELNNPALPLHLAVQKVVLPLAANSQPRYRF